MPPQQPEPAPAQPAPPTKSAPKPEPPESQPPTSIKSAINIPGYTIISKLGESESFTVWKAKQESLNRFVTIKILKAHYSKDQKEVEGFFSEAKIAARIKSSNVIRVYDIGAYEDTFYFVMEFVDGKALKYLLDSQISLPQDKALAIAAAIAEGLHEAWSRHQIFHRNINPSNIRLDKDGGIKLANLGLVSIIQSQCGSADSQKRIQRDPHYMSPEQAAGSKVDYRTDMYSLGALLYHMVTGIIPFDDKDFDDVLKAQQNDQLLHPCDVNPDITKGCAQIIARLMMKEPRHRFRDWETVYEDLIKLSESKIVVTRCAPGAVSTVAKPKSAGGAGAKGKQIRTKAASRPVGSTGGPRKPMVASKKPGAADNEKLKELKNKYTKRKAPKAMTIPLELAMAGWFIWLGYNLLWAPLHQQQPDQKTPPEAMQSIADQQIDSPAYTPDSSTVEPVQYHRHSPNRNDNDTATTSQPQNTEQANENPADSTPAQEPAHSVTPLPKLKRQIVKTLFSDGAPAALQLLKTEYPDRNSSGQVTELYHLLSEGDFKDKAIANAFKKAIGRKTEILYKGRRRNIMVNSVNGNKISVDVYTSRGSGSVKRPATFKVSELDPLEQSRWLGPTDNASPDIAIAKFILHMTAGDYMTAKSIANKCGPLAKACAAEADEKIKMLIQ